MTTLSFDVLWRDRGAAQGMQNLARHTRTAELGFNKLHSSTVRGMTAAHVAGGLILKGLTAAKNGLLAPINNASKFEKSMRLIGVTSGQSGQGLKDLTKLALDMGAKTSFSAQGASDAMLALAKGGMTAAQIKAGALQSTLTLATAGGLELGKAADFMVQGLTSFGLKAGQAGRVAAALAGGANASTASVQSMGLALSQVGAGAKTAGLSLEDTTAALAAFANAGVQGSDAGTSLKTFLQRLVPSTDAASGAMRKLGLITKDGGNQFFDAHGKIKSMAEVSGVLQKALQGQTREQKIATLTTIFGSDASRAAAILADEGAKGIAKYVKATSDKSAAEALAKNATLGYAGALERFKGSVETAGIQVGTKLLPVLAKLLDWMSGKALPALSQLAPAFSVLGSSLGTLGKTVKVVFSSIAAGFGLGKGSFQDFSDFIATHQADITAGIITGGKAFVAFGKVLAQVASAGLKAFAFLAAGQADMLEVLLGGFGLITRGAALAFGWIPGVGENFKRADATFRGFAAGAVGGLRGVAASAKDLAAGVDGKLLPGLNKAGTSLDALGRKEIASARNRDIMAKAENRHRDAVNAATVAAKANGKTLDSNTISGRSNRVALNGLVASSQNYISKLVTTHASSKRVTAATKDARAEFIRVATSMGVSSARAKDLADKYFKVPKKVKTDVTQPGMDRARNQTKGLDSDINHLNNKSVSVHVQVNTSLNALNRALVRKYGSGAVKMAAASGGEVPGNSPTASADDVPARLTSGEWVIKRPSARRYGKAAMRAVNEGRATIGYAAGGEVRRTITERVNAAGVVYNYGKIRDYATRESSSAGAAMSRDLGGQAVRAAGAAAVAAAKAARAAAQAAASLSSGSFSGSLPGGRGAAGIRAIARALGASYIAAHRDPQGGPAFDLGSSGARNNRIANALRSAHGRLGLRYVISQMRISSARSGWRWRRYSPITGSGDFRHVGHVHVSYDKGGLLRPGGVAVNYRGGTERVLTHRQNRNYEDLVRVMDRRGGGAVQYHITINAPNYIGSQAELKQTLVSMARRGDLAVIQR